MLATSAPGDESAAKPILCQYPIVDEVPAEMVKETDLSDDQGPIRTFDNGMLNARLYVALQEAIAKIETLEAKVAALEG